MENQRVSEDSGNLLHDLKSDLLPEEVFAFTPKGDVINLPTGATCIDFAYAIHSAVGNRMVGCKVNNRMVPIDHIVSTGKLKEEWQQLKASEEKAGEDLPKVDLSRVHATDGVVVEGFDNTPIKFAKCCSPLPGDPIVGFITRGFGVSIHKQSCVNAISSMKDPTNAPRWVKAYWADSVKDSYKAGIEIIALNRNELLQDVLAALADIRVPIYAVNARQVENNCAMVSLTIGINNTEHLNRVVARLSKVKDVLKVTRS